MALFLLVRGEGDRRFKRVLLVLLVVYLDHIGGRDALYGVLAWLDYFLDIDMAIVKLNLFIVDNWLSWLSWCRIALMLLQLLHKRMTSMRRCIVLNLI